MLLRCSCSLLDLTWVWGRGDGGKHLTSTTDCLFNRISTYFIYHLWLQLAIWAATLIFDVRVLHTAPLILYNQIALCSKFTSYPKHDQCEAEKCYVVRRSCVSARQRWIKREHRWVVWPWKALFSDSGSLVYQNDQKRPRMCRICARYWTASQQDVS